MNTRASKGLKPLIYNVIIISMSLPYVFGPVHEEVNKLLHAVVHSLEIPDNVLSHQKTANTSKTTIHKSDHHKNIKKHHTHEVITFLDEILKKSDQKKDASNTIIVSHKIDKHINNYEYLFMNDNEMLFFLKTKHRFSKNKKGVCKGYLKAFIEPPKSMIIHTRLT